MEPARSQRLSEVTRMQPEQLNYLNTGLGSTEAKWSHVATPACSSFPLQKESRSCS